MKPKQVLSLSWKTSIGVTAACLCVLCVVQNVISFLELYGEESVVFTQVFQKGPFEPPAIVFLGNDIGVAHCSNESDSSWQTGCDFVKLVYDFTVRDVVEYRDMFLRLPRWASKATITTIRNMPNCAPLSAQSRSRRAAAVSAHVSHAEVGQVSDAEVEQVSDAEVEHVSDPTQVESVSHAEVDQVSDTEVEQVSDTGVEEVLEVDYEVLSREKRAATVLEVGGQTYQVVLGFMNNTGTWADASAFCVANGGIVYAPETNTVANIVLRALGVDEDSPTLMGWNLISGQWKAQDGRALPGADALWAMYQPGGDSCTAYRTYTLSTVPCTNSLPYVCDLRDVYYRFSSEMTAPQGFAFCEGQEMCVFKPRTLHEAVAVAQHRHMSVYTQDPSQQDEEIVVTGFKKDPAESWTTYKTANAAATTLWEFLNVMNSADSHTFVWGKFANGNAATVYQFKTVSNTQTGLGTICDTTDRSCFPTTTAAATTTPAPTTTATGGKGVTTTARGLTELEEEFCDVVDLIDDLPEHELEPFVMVAIRGPSQWETRQLVEVRISLNQNDTGTHRLVTKSYPEMKELFLGAQSDKTKRYHLLLELLVYHSWNFSPAKLDQFVQLSKTESHKPNGTIEYRFKQESTHKAGQNVSEAGFSMRWKDGIYFIAKYSRAFDIWTALAYMIGALLMLERGAKGASGVVNMLRAQRNASKAAKVAPASGSDKPTKISKTAVQRIKVKPSDFDSELQLRHRNESVEIAQAIPIPRPFVPRNMMHDF